MYYFEELVGKYAGGTCNIASDDTGKLPLKCLMWKGMFMVYFKVPFWH